MAGLRWTDDQLQDYLRRRGGHGSANPTPAPTPPAPDGQEEKPRRRNKYNAVRTEVDGEMCDSKREAARYRELKLMLAAGEIAGLGFQVPFRLPGGIVYRADFVVFLQNGSYRVEDAKGRRTDVYRMKKKLMKECLGIEIVEV